MCPTQDSNLLPQGYKNIGPGIADHSANIFKLVYCVQFVDIWSQNMWNF